MRSEGAGADGVSTSGVAVPAATCFTQALAAAAVDAAAAMVTGFATVGLLGPKIPHAQLRTRVRGVAAACRFKI